MRPSWKFLIGILAMVAVAAGAWWYLTVAGYDGPPVTRDPVTAMSRPSSVNVPIEVSLDELQRQANEKIPTTLATIDENRDACVPAKMGEIDLWIGKIKTYISPQIDCHLEGKVTRGQIAVGGAGPSITVGTSISAEVTVRGRGEIGKHIQETGTGTVDGVAAVTADIGPDWTASADVSPDYTWSDRFGIDVLGIRITFASRIDPTIKEQIAKFKESLPSLLAELKLRERASEGWSKSFVTLEASAAPPVWIRFAPEAIGFSGYSIDGRVLKANLKVDGVVETVLGTRPGDPAATPLPQLGRAGPDGGFDVFVPVLASYDALAQEARKSLKLGVEQTVQVGGIGDVRVVVDDVAVHQTTGRKLAIGLKLKAKPAQSYLSTTGWVWLIADAAIDNEAHRVVTKSVAVYSRTDNAPIDLLVSLVQVPALNEKIREGLTYDFTRDHARVLEESSKLLKRSLAENVRMEGSLASASAEQLQFGPDGIVVGLAATGAVRLLVGAP